MVLILKDDKITKISSFLVSVNRLKRRNWNSKGVWKWYKGLIIQFVETETETEKKVIVGKDVEVINDQWRFLILLLISWFKSVWIRFGVWTRFKIFLVFYRQGFNAPANNVETNHHLPNMKFVTALIDA